MASKEFSNVRDFKIDNNGEGSSVSRGGSENIGMYKSKRFDNSKVKRFTCEKNHFIRDCPEMKGNDDSFLTTISSAKDSYESSDALWVLGLETKES